MSTDPTNDQLILQACQEAVNEINVILTRLNSIYPEAGWTILLNWIADAMIFSNLEPEQYIDALFQGIQDIYVRKMSEHIFESQRSTKH